MSISKFEMYHGAVLSQVTRNPEMSLKLIERDKEKQSWGMYCVIAGKSDYILFIKSTSKINDGKKFTYSNLTFSTNNLERLKKYTSKEIIICLVCHDELICYLTKSDINELKLLDSCKSCRVTVYWNKGTGLTVGSTFAKLTHKISRSRLKNFEWT